MLTKIFIHNKAYEVDLLTADEVIQQIKTDFIGSETTAALQKANELDKVINQYIDYYEKIEYQNKNYFVFKSNIPLEFKQKTYSKKKFISSDEMAGRFFGSLIGPVTFISTNIFDMVWNIKNMVKSTFGSTKINAKFRDSEVTLLCAGVAALNIAFWVWFGVGVKSETHPFWIVFIVQAINVLLGVLKPIRYHYNDVENYKLAPYTFDTKYESLSADPMERLHAMKTTQDKKKIDFDFTEEGKEKDKEKSYATY